MGSSLGLRVSDDQLNLFRIDIDTGTHKPVSAPVRLTERSRINTMGVPSPDGRRIAYVALTEPSGFSVMDANGAQETVVMNPGPNRLSAMQLLGWRSDEELVVAEASYRVGDFNKAPKNLMVLSLATRDLRALPAAVEEGSGPMLVARHSVLFVSTKDQQIVVRPLMGGPESLDGDPEGLRRGDCSLDGKWLAYSAEEPRPTSTGHLGRDSHQVARDRRRPPGRSLPELPPRIEPSVQLFAERPLPHLRWSAAGFPNHGSRHAAHPGR